MPVSRRQIVRACNARGWQIQPAALKGLEAYLKRCDAVEEELLDSIAEHMVDASNRVLTNDIWQAFLKAEEEYLTSGAEGNNGGSTSTSLNPWSDLQVVSAFRDVRLSYHSMKKSFQAEEQPWPLFGTAEDKVRRS